MRFSVLCLLVSLAVASAVSLRAGGRADGEVSFVQLRTAVEAGAPVDVIEQMLQQIESRVKEAQADHRSSFTQLHDDCKKHVGEVKEATDGYERELKEAEAAKAAADKAVADNGAAQEEVKAELPKRIATSKALQQHILALGAQLQKAKDLRDSYVAAHGKTHRDLQGALEVALQIIHLMKRGYEDELTEATGADSASLGSKAVPDAVKGPGASKADAPIAATVDDLVSDARKAVEEAGGSSELVGDSASDELPDDEDGEGGEAEAEAAGEAVEQVGGDEDEEEVPVSFLQLHTAVQLARSNEHTAELVPALLQLSRKRLPNLENVQIKRDGSEDLYQTLFAMQNGLDKQLKRVEAAITEVDNNFLDTKEEYQQKIAEEGAKLAAADPSPLREQLAALEKKETELKLAQHKAAAAAENAKSVVARWTKTLGEREQECHSQQKNFDATSSELQNQLDLTAQLRSQVQKKLEAVKDILNRNLGGDAAL
eukprot:PLAT15591.1.p1 GENE.PLAT15591.1~~PLAT15591.1.p1  ORF type:complete len:486 (+),score=315.13 PLAT15591.1:52-1509(+)